MGNPQLGGTIMVTGIIYKYTSPNGKSYIGQTRTSIERRRKNEYGTGYSGSPSFYHAIQKYGGLQNFEYEELERVDVELLDEREVYYIQKYKTITPHGYNIESGGQRPGGKANGRKVQKYNDKKELLDTYDNIDVAAEANQCSLQCIWHAISGRCATGKGYYWAYEGEVPTFKRGKRKRVYQFDLKGNLVNEFESAANADRYCGNSIGSAADCANKKRKRKRVGNYIFTYDNELDREYYNVP